MADDLKRVGLVFKADGTVDFKKSITEINAVIEENKSAFELAKRQWDENTKAADKLSDRQKYLAQQTKNYTDKTKILREELKELEGAENRDETALAKKRKELNKAESSLIYYKRSLSEVEKELKSGSYKIQEYTDKIDKFSEKAKKVGDNLSGISTAATGVLAGAAAMVPATEEYRKIMGSLEVSSEMAGYTAEQTKETYEQLFGVLGDDQSAATTTANLQALGIEQSKLVSLTDGVIGAWAKYGDSIPIDGLAEAVNETVKVGQVTGNFADVLNWGAKEGETFGVKLKAATEANEEWNNAVKEAKSAEDYFNLALQDCSNETERANLIMQFMAEQGLEQAGQKWKENNKNLVEGNQATAEMKEATADLAETIAPIITDVTSIMADLLDGFNSLPSGVQGTIGVVLILVAVLSSAFSVIGSVSSGISSLTKILGPATAGTWSLNAAWLASPITWWIAGIMLVVGVLILLYNKCEGFRNGVNAIGKAIADFFTVTLPEVIKKAIDWIADNWQGLLLLLVNPFAGGFKLLYDNCEGFRKFIDNFIDKIGDKIGEIGEFFSGIGDDIKNAWRKIKNAIKTPHFKTSGEFSLSPLKVPSISVDWYAKGGILNRPTAFDISGNRVKVGGEAGPEAVLPIELLKKYIREENNANNSVLAMMIKEAVSELNLIAENNIYIGDKKFFDVITNMVIRKISSNVNDRNFAKGLT